MNIAIWTVDEKAILDSVVILLDNTRRTADRDQLRKNIHALEIQAWAIGLYPPIIECNRLGSGERNIETLVMTLIEKYPAEDLFAMPSKAVLGRGFVISKVNLFYMLLLLIGNDPAGEDLVARVRECILHSIISVLTEDVLMELIGDPYNCAVVREQAARALATMWEFRTDPEADNFNPALALLWRVRRESLPVYGTLMGTHEYLRLNGRADETCREYILHASDIDDETDALEEFLFGICYEDLVIIKQRMASERRTCIDRKELTAMVGKDSVFLCGGDEDPLELYRFFNHRRKRAFVRRNSQVKGPIRTFEENFLSYLLIKNIGKEAEVLSGRQVEAEA
ncbi:MAG: hypothetical protein JXA18_07450 [Chitinispirillaceae bacterium]|nr:hypothetical protein [Chitinispirillaceae bacterium]